MELLFKLRFLQLIKGATFIVGNFYVRMHQNQVSRINVTEMRTRANPIKEVKSYREQIRHNAKYVTTYDFNYCFVKM